MGGGLAGLALALQLRNRCAGMSVAVVERRKHPVREAAHKVGESTVEIGAHYFAEVLGLREHLETEQIRKYGLRYFFADGHHNIHDCSELGVSRLLPTPSWQIDRGRFENFLGERAMAAGVEFHDDCVIRSIALNEAGGSHEVSFEHAGQTTTLRARWVVDATGRAGLLKRKLDLAQPNDHDVNAVWWRVDGHLDLDAWSDDPAWLERFAPAERWKSTNHMCGPGYWFWLIPLASGSHSLGIVCDAKIHPLETMNTHDKAMAWLRKHQPRVAAAVDQPEHALQDFLFLRHFSYGCKQVFSEHRWALTGEAGLFLDPFYSPGSDFIAISNTYICDLIEKERAGKLIDPFVVIYEQLYFSFYESALSLYQDQYPIFGHPQAMPLKVLWDYAYYWALLAPMFIGDRQTDLKLLMQLKPAFAQGQLLNLGVQALLRDWGLRDPLPRPTGGRGLDQYQLGWCREMNRALTDKLDDAQYAARTHELIASLRQLALEILALARGAFPDIDDHGLDALTKGAINGGEPMLPEAWWKADSASANHHQVQAEPVT
jgi:flavin-dependent dehydrogenase